ncbi:hypothetical protein [Stenotrophomonas terrae]|nr:hypothetical protein [Stenotrophomonas terrae]
MHAKIFFTILLGWLFVCGNAAAYKINPLQNKYRQDSRTILRKASEPIHEEVTQLARACQQANAGPVLAALVCNDRSTPSKEPGGNKYDSLIRGVWWNDDPNQLLFALRQAEFAAWMDDAKRIAVTGVNWKGRKATIGPDYNMTYRGHYGDLQFIHAMASEDGEPAQVTQQNILDWAEFAFAVATGRLDPETKMNQAGPTRLQEYFEQQSGWTVNYLFAPKYRLKNAQYTRNMAAGSLLHMVQDSYAAAHSRRDFGATARCPAGRVVQFYSYINQSPELHADEDGRIAWQTGEFTGAQDPVNVSATLLAHIQQKTDWTTVRDYLRDIVFCVDDDVQDAGPGEFAAVRAMENSK